MKDLNVHLPPMAPPVATAEPTRSAAALSPPAADGSSRVIGRSRGGAAPALLASTRGAAADSKSAPAGRNLSVAYQQTWSAMARGVGESAAVYEVEDASSESMQLDDALDVDGDDATDDGDPASPVGIGGTGPRRQQASARGLSQLGTRQRHAQQRPQRRKERERREHPDGEMAIDDASDAPANDAAWSSGMHRPADVATGPLSSLPAPVGRATAVPRFPSIAGVPPKTRASPPSATASVSADMAPWAWGFAAVVVVAIAAVVSLIFAPGNTVPTGESPQQNKPAARDGAGQRANG